MLKITMDPENGTALFEPDGTLSKDDFDYASKVVDQYLADHKQLNGLIIFTKAFPGWDSLGALVKHLQFVKGHHSRLRHVALVTDSKLGDALEKAADHFSAAEIKHFPYGRLDAAKAWIRGSS